MIQINTAPMEPITPNTVPWAPIVGHHALIPMGAFFALEAQVQNVNQIGALIKTSTLVVAALAANLEKIIDQMNQTLTDDQGKESAVNQEWGVEPQTDAEWQAWANKYAASMGWPSWGGVLPELWENYSEKWLATLLNNCQNQFNADQLIGQANVSAAHRPIDLWTNTLTAENQSTTTDYKLCQSLLSVLKNLVRQIRAGGG